MLTLHSLHCNILYKNNCYSSSHNVSSVSMDNFYLQAGTNNNCDPSGPSGWLVYKDYTHYI